MAEEIDPTKRSYAMAARNLTRPSPKADLDPTYTLPLEALNTRNWSVRLTNERLCASLVPSRLPLPVVR